MRINSQRSLAWGFFCDILTNLNFGCLAFDFWTPEVRGSGIDSEQESTLVKFHKNLAESHFHCCQMYCIKYFHRESAANYFAFRYVAVEFN